jgi:hypothetical protein
MRLLSVLLIGALILVAGTSFADDTAKVAEPISIKELKLPDMQAGMVYSAQDSEFSTCFTATLLKYPTKIGDLELRGGYMVDKTPFGALTFKLGDLTQFGFEMPLHHLINVSAGPYVGYAMDNKEISYGILCTVIQVKF